MSVDDPAAVALTVGPNHPPSKAEIANTTVKSMIPRLEECVTSIDPRFLPRAESIAYHFAPV